MRRTRLLAMAVPLIVAAGCSSSGSAGTVSATGSPAAGAALAAQSAAPPVALNPVDLIRKAGGDPEAGATVGSTDAQGNRYASGEIGPDDKGAREEIRVYVWTGTPWPGKPSDDSTWNIRGTGFEVNLTGIVGDNGTVFTVAPEVVAQRLGGMVVPRG